MSYDLEFDCGPLPAVHNIAGGTQEMGGTRDPWLNITWNYASFFYRAWPEGGIRSLYGRTAAEVLRELDLVIPTLAEGPDANYWAATEGNARKALEDLRALAALCPPGAVLSGD